MSLITALISVSPDTNEILCKQKLFVFILNYSLFKLVPLITSNSSLNHGFLEYILISAFLIVINRIFSIIRFLFYPHGK